MKNIIILLLSILVPSIIFAKWITWDASGEVYKVTDGDTIKIEATDGNDYTLRILWLDTPEKYTTRFGYVECYWQESSAYAQTLIDSYSGRVYVEFYGDDKYNRDLAEVYLWSHTWAIFAEVMIRDGYGFVYKKWIKTKNYQKLIRAEQYAKRNKLGLWNQDTCSGKRIPSISSGSVSNTWSSETKKATPKKIWVDFSQVMKQNSEISQQNAEAQKLRDEQAKKDQEERDRKNAEELKKYQEYLKSLEGSSSSSSYGGWSSSNGGYTCYTGPRWGRYHYSSSWNKVYSGCD